MAKNQGEAQAARSTTSATPPSMTVPTVSDSPRRAGTDALKPIEDTGEQGRRWGGDGGCWEENGREGFKKNSAWRPKKSAITFT